MIHLPDLSIRNRRPELMDNPSVSTTELNRALRALGLMNTLSLSAYSISNAIIRLIGPRPQSLRILDIGSGRGDILCSVSDRLRKRGYDIDALGIDMNPKSVELAALYAKANNCRARFETATAIYALKTFEYDLVISSLFLHHFSEEDIVSLFSAIKERASIGMVMSDIERSPLGFGLAWLATHGLSGSSIVHYDGPVSVQGALIQEEFQELASRAALQNCQFSRTFPFRLMISWKKEFNEVNNHPR